VILPKDPDPLLPHLTTLRTIYPLDALFLKAPLSCKNKTLPVADEIFFYSHLEETLVEDYRFKLVFNFTDYKPIKRHYLALSAFEVLSLKDLIKLAGPEKQDLSDVLKRALTRPGSLWQKETQHAR
jgi:hypothetical protein